nr:lysophospholipid acyltransferase family protein [Pseudohalocynthiibacter sp. F2068]
MNAKRYNSNATTVEPRAGIALPRPRTDAFLRSLGRITLGSFFRKIEVVGIDRFPVTGPVIVVANHFNSLVDGAIITTFLPRMPRFLAASTVWDFKPIIPLLNAAGAVPVYRRQDGRHEEGSLTDSFSKATELLAAGGILAIFPEGISHNEPHVLPLKSGAARIALEAEANHGPLGVKIVPVCLTFDAKNKFRSRVLVEIGDLIEVNADHVDRFSSSKSATRTSSAKDLTEQFRRGLESITPMHETWEEAHLIGRAAEMLAQSKPEGSSQRGLADTTASRRALREGYVWARQLHPEKTAALRNDLIEYDRMLRATGLQDDQVAAGRLTGSKMQFIVQPLLSLVVRVPPAFVGLVLNWVPYRVLLAMSRRRDLDKRSTWSIFAGLFIFPAFWAIAALVAGRLAAGYWGSTLGWAAGVTLLGLAPVTGKVTLTFIEVLSAVFADARAWRFFRATTRQNDTLIRKRDIIVEKLTALAEAFRAEHTVADPTNEPPNET